ncbi:MAG: septum formation protein Maf [Chloroflexota bacterium]|nr:MAG: septum formation protein Maf [Chloroflexota bacterium]
MPAVRLILASASQRRRALLDTFKLPFAVGAADVDETPRPGEPGHELAVRLARAKALTVAGGTDGFVLAADTVVWRRDHLYGKPEDADDARAILRQLRGGTHLVTTAVALARGSVIDERSVTSRVTLRAMRNDEIEAYVASGDPLDKAGAYAIQNRDFKPVSRVTGCRCAVVGLPIGVVHALLSSRGVVTPLSPRECCPYRYGENRCVPEARPAPI